MMIVNSIHWGLCALPRDLRVNVAYTAAHYQNIGEVINRGLGQKKEEKRKFHLHYTFKRTSAFFPLQSLFLLFSRSVMYDSL